MPCPTGENPCNIIRPFDDKENTCPGQLPGYLCLPLLTGGFDLVISQPHYDIKLEFAHHVLSYYAASNSPGESFSNNI